MSTSRLVKIAAQYPFPDYAEWWVMGEEFLHFMSQAITSEWEKLPHQEQDLAQIQAFVSAYVRIVYSREANPSLAARFYAQDFARPMQSGEFDALSYAFYRSAYKRLADQATGDKRILAKARRSFAERVGKVFFSALYNHLQLDLPSALNEATQFTGLKKNIDIIGDFLVAQGYLRDHFAFSFDVDTMHAGKQIRQAAGDFLHNLHHNGTAYALYEMGYPAILPSAVYLFHTHGEAQHHSSRTIEDLFEHIGCQARETDDFDPTGFPADRVVELWEISPG